MDPVPNASANPESGSRLKARYRATEDGGKAYDPGWWYDSERRETCAFVVAGDGQERCLPLSSPSASVGVYFSDARCSVPIAAYTAGCPPKYVVSSTVLNGECGAVALRTRIFAVGPRFTDTLYYGSASSCATIAASDTYDYYAIGDEIPPTSFVAGSWGVDP
ncbi:DUF7481 family protein [Sorangium sp. So ce1078]|uniref:DUF7481 family protein n=1 Tax=Sorangium sp. So ce1078 TaxID=3133329 RepID=UPI003F5FC00E